MKRHWETSEGSLAIWLKLKRGIRVTSGPSKQLKRHPFSWLCWRWIKVRLTSPSKEPSLGDLVVSELQVHQRLGKWAHRFCQIVVIYVQLLQLLQFREKPFLLSWNFLEGCGFRMSHCRSVTGFSKAFSPMWSIWLFKVKVLDSRRHHWHALQFQLIVVHGCGIAFRAVTFWCTAWWWPPILIGGNRNNHSAIRIGAAGTTN